MYLITLELVEDLAEAGCPVCRGAHRAGWEWVHGLLHEDANDPHVREALDRDGGLCPDHTRLLVTVASYEADSLGLSIVMEFLLADAARRLADQERAGGSPPPRGPWKRRTRKALTARTCGACEAEARRAAAYVEILTQNPAAYLKRASEDPDRALCLVHVAAAIAAGHPGAGDLIPAARRRAEALRACLAATVTAHASTTGLPLVHDPVLWRAAPDWLAGAPRDPPRRRGDPLGRSPAP